MVHCGWSSWRVGTSTAKTPFSSFRSYPLNTTSASYFRNMLHDNPPKSKWLKIIIYFLLVHLGHPKGPSSPGMGAGRDGHSPRCVVMTLAEVQEGRAHKHTKAPRASAWGWHIITCRPIPLSEQSLQWRDRTAKGKGRGPRTGERSPKQR